MRKEGELVLLVHSSVVLPRNALGTGHVLLEARSQPRITSKVFSREINVFVFHFLGRHLRGSQFQNLVSFSYKLVLLLVLLAIVNRFSVDVVVCIVVRRRHVYRNN